MSPARPALRERVAAPVGRRIRVRGAVQGVGFRPFVHRQATALGLSGWVTNTPDGVTIEASGTQADIDSLIDAIAHAPPPNAQVAGIEIDEIAAAAQTGFAIRASQIAGVASAEILPDIATCDACLAELFDPANRRHLYPFVNCTHCGPRYSIVEAIPYDRARTSMRRFPLCPACQAEYDDPADRRFHAEANACPVCGPSLTLWDGEGRTLARFHGALLATVTALCQGRIVAVKGIGGFHLMCDAGNEASVQRLRQRKHRPDRPLAVMFPSLAALEVECPVSPLECDLLCGPAHPIVLLRRLGDAVAPSVAPGNPWLGAMLPYAPLHHLLLSEFGRPLVATSGNVSDETIVTDEADALRRLGGIAELFLVHDRPIVRPLDDSVVRVVAGRELVLRRARGLAPLAVPVAGVAAGILAVGGHLKTTIAVTRAGSVVLGPHIGDLETLAARDAHRRAIDDSTSLMGGAIERVAHDMHPDYPSTGEARALDRPMIAVQHHLAHVVACMADNGIEPPVLGVAWDGTGFGADGTIWGGEFIVVEPESWRRVAHLRTFPLPGGEAVAREPRRAALGLLYASFGADALEMTDLPAVSSFTAAERRVLGGMLERGVNCPGTSSAGRFFDAVAALCGLRQRASYEGQAAAELEWAADGATAHRAYEFPVAEGEEGESIVDWRPALASILEDVRAGIAPGAISAALHAGLAAAIVVVARRIGIPRVALTGGCFQNARLTETSIGALRAAGFEPIWHRRVPPNDGGIALGQAVWVSRVAQRSLPPCV